MLVKVMLLFLALMALLAMLAKTFRPQIRRARGRCAACGRPRIGPGNCPCGRN